jgi:hypothetical protein
MKKFLLTLAITSLITSSVFASDIPVPKNPEDMLSESYTGISYSPYAGKTFPSQVYWGDTQGKRI